MRLLIIKRLHKAKNIVKDQAERLEKPSVVRGESQHLQKVPLPTAKCQS